MGNLSVFGDNGGNLVDFGGDPSLEHLGVGEFAGLVPAPEGTRVECFEPCVEVLPPVDAGGDVIGEVNGDVIGDVNGDVIGEMNDNVSSHAKGITGYLSGDAIGDVRSDVTTDVVKGNISDLRVKISSETSDGTPNAIDEVDRSSSSSIPLPPPTGNEQTWDALVQPETVGIPHANSLSSHDQAKPDTLIESDEDSSSITTSVAQEDIATISPPEILENLNVPAVRVVEHAWGTAGLDWATNDALSGVNDHSSSSSGTESERIGKEVRERDSELPRSSHHQHGFRRESELETSIHTEDLFGGPEASPSAVYDTTQFRGARGFVDESVSCEEEGIDPVLQGDSANGPRYADRGCYEGRPEGNMLHPVDGLLETPQRGDSGVSPMVSPAQEIDHDGEAAVGVLESERTALSRAGGLESGAPEWEDTVQGAGDSEASFGARELLERRDALEGNEGKETVLEGVRGVSREDETLGDVQRCVGRGLASVQSQVLFWSGGGREVSRSPLFLSQCTHIR